MAMLLFFFFWPEVEALGYVMKGSRWNEFKKTKRNNCAAGRYVKQMKGQEEVVLQGQQAHKKTEKCG